MTEYDNTNSGGLFKNERTNDRQPNMRGIVNIEGTEYWVSAWTRTIKKGKREGEKMISMAFEKKEDQPPAPSQNENPSSDFDEDDDIPF